MPIVRMPDGNNVSFPDDLPPGEIRALIASKFPDDVPSEPLTAEQKTIPQSLARTALDQGLQGATLNFGDEVVDYLGATFAKNLPKWAGGRPDLMEDIEAGDLYNEARQNSKTRLSQQIEQNPVTAIGSSIGGALLGGGAGATTKAGKGIINSLRTGNIATRLAKGAAAGGAIGAISGYGRGSTTGERLENAAFDTALGSGLGIAAPAIAGTVGAVKRAVTPAADEGLRAVGQLAQKYNIPVSLTQISDSKALNNIQKVSQELPFSGEKAFRDRQMRAFNHELIKTIGGKQVKFTPELMDDIFTQVGKEFDSLGRGKTFKTDNFRQAIDEIEADIGIANRDAQESFHSVLNGILKEVDSQGNIAGEKLAFQRARINRLARKATNPDTKELLRDLENTLIDTMTVGDDVAKEAFSKTKEKYKNLLVLEPLVAKAKGGNISPSLLRNRVEKIYGRQYVRGKAGAIGDLARIGHELLPELGGSDTTQKLLYATGATGGALANAPLTAAGLAGNRLYQSAINRNQEVVRKALARGMTPKEIMQLPPREAEAILKGAK